MGWRQQGKIFQVCNTKASVTARFVIARFRCNFKVYSHTRQFFFPLSAWYSEDPAYIENGLALKQGQPSHVGPENPRVTKIVDPSALRYTLSGIARGELCVDRPRGGALYSSLGTAMVDI